MFCFFSPKFPKVCATVSQTQWAGRPSARLWRSSREELKLNRAGPKVSPHASDAQMSVLVCYLGVGGGGLSDPLPLSLSCSTDNLRFNTHTHTHKCASIATHCYAADCYFAEMTCEVMTFQWRLKHANVVTFTLNTLNSSS